MIVDETTDCSTEKACAMIVKYFDKDTNKIKAAMLDITNVYEGNGGSTGESLFSLIIQTLAKFNIPLNNMVGFAADGASNIMGTMNSVSSRLKIQTYAWNHHLSVCCTQYSFMQQ